MIRLNRYLALCGVAARRKADLLIAEGRVTVNGAVPPPGGVLVAPGRDEVRVDGGVVTRGERAMRYFAVNKPPGYLSAVSDRSRRPLVVGLVPDPVPGLAPVGRLDLESRGLILLTDDGEMSFRLQHPRHHVEKEYEVTVSGAVTEAQLAKLRAGVKLEEGTTAPARYDVIEESAGSTRLRAVLRQGWKRQVRRSLASVRLRVTDLCRVRIGPLLLGDLPAGKSRPLLPGEVAALRAAVGLEP
jgi:23S rRNA pseudouridine2605 synthase